MIKEALISWINLIEEPSSYWGIFLMVENFYDLLDNDRKSWYTPVTPWPTPAEYQKIKAKEWMEELEKRLQCGAVLHPIELLIAMESLRRKK